MARGIGVRYSERGFRALELERSGGILSVTGLAAGSSGDDVDAFLAEYGMGAGDAGIAVGLGPGNFLSASVDRGAGMSGRDVEEQLHWEIERKMLTPWDTHTVSLVLSGAAGFVFAARKDLARKLRGASGAPHVIDVEPFALFNGCEAAGEIDGRAAVIAAVEAEGISTVLVEDRTPVAVESFVAPVEGDTAALAGLEFEGTELHDEKAGAEFVKTITESVSRLTMRGKENGRKFPERLILAGGGVYVQGLARMIAESTGLETVVSDPFLSLSVEMTAEAPRLAEMGAAFTSCFGLALRALER